jgi:hypothetical protein
MASGLFRPGEPVTRAAARPAPGAVRDPVDDHVPVSAEPESAGIGLTTAELFAAPRHAPHTMTQRTVADWYPGLRRLVDEVAPDPVVRTTRRVRPVPAWPAGRVTMPGEAFPWAPTQPSALASSSTPLPQS